MAVSYVAAATDHQQLSWLGGGVMEVLLDGGHTDGRLAMFRSNAPAGAASPAHVHTREDEIIVILRGSGIFWAGDERFEVGEGGVVFLPRGVPHAYRITSDADMLALSTPSGLEDFFRGAGHDLRTPVPEGWDITPRTMGRAAAANGQIILGPPLGPDDELPAHSDTEPGGSPYAARDGEHETLEWIGGGLMRVLLGSDHTGGRLSMFRSSAAAGSASPVYMHSSEDEIIVMLSGSGIYRVGDQRVEVGEGGLVYVPRGVPMAYRITSNAETLAVTTPGGLEAFFRMAGRDVREPRPDGWEVSREMLAQASEATGQTILGPPSDLDSATSLPDSPDPHMLRTRPGGGTGQAPSR